MLYRFLEEISSGKARNLPEVAHKLGISVDMAKKIARELAEKGYLNEMGEDCSTSHDACSKCNMSSSCQAHVRGWYITEKGLSTLINNSVGRA